MKVKAFSDVKAKHVEASTKMHNLIKPSITCDAMSPS